MITRSMIFVAAVMVAVPFAPAGAQSDTPSSPAQQPDAAPPQPPRDIPSADGPAAPPHPQASAPAAGNEDGRYSFNRVQDGYLRLDSQTGQVSLCGRRQVGWACQVLPDDRIVLENEITRLHVENGALKKALLSHGLPLPSGVSAPRPQAKSKPDKEPSADASNVDRFMAAVTSTWRRLVDMITTMRRDVMKDG